MNFKDEIVDSSDVLLRLPQDINEYIYETFFELKPDNE